MLNQSGVTKTSYGSKQQILGNVELQYSVGVVVAAAAGVTVGSKKFVKAGTPLSGDLKARTTPFVVGAPGSNTVTGVLLHDVEVTEGDGNGTLLLWGVVNTNRLEADVKALYTDDMYDALSVAGLGILALPL